MQNETLSDAKSINIINDETHMIDHNHLENIIFNHVRFASGEPFGIHHTFKIKIIL